jgi:DNA-binding Lrp family transcriptional regulator
MVVRAYVLINLASKNVKKILQTLLATKGVISVEAVTGPYDIVVLLEAQDTDAIGQLVTKEILSIEGIDRTLTSIVLHL